MIESNEGKTLITTWNKALIVIEVGVERYLSDLGGLPVGSPRSFMKISWPQAILSCWTPRGTHASIQWTKDTNILGRRDFTRQRLPSPTCSPRVSLGLVSISPWCARRS